MKRTLSLAVEPPSCRRVRRLHLLRHGGWSVGFIAIEAKYTESMTEPAKVLNPRYEVLAPESGLFIDPMAVELRQAPLQQMFRQHVLAQAMIVRGDASEGRVVMLAPALNGEVRRALSDYEKHLNSAANNKAGYEAWTLEQFIQVLGTLGDGEYASRLHDRYLDWSRIENALEAGFAARLAG